MSTTEKYPPTIKAADGVHTLNRYELEGIVYAPTRAEAQARMADLKMYEVHAAVEDAAAPWPCPEGHRHFGCPGCGRVWTLPSNPDEPGPACNGSSYNWHREGEGWTQTVPISVREGAER